MKPVDKNNDFFYFWVPLLLLFGAAFVFYAFAWSGPPVMEPDTGSYMEVAQDLQDGRIDMLHGRTLGFPLLLILTGSNPTPTRALFYTQFILYLSTTAAIAYLLLRFSIPKKWIMAFTLLCLLPYNIGYTDYALTETLTQFTLIGGFVLLIIGLKKDQQRWFIAAALLLAFCALVRPTYQTTSVLTAIILGAMSFIFTRLKRRLWIAAAWLVGIAILVIGGVILYNRTNFGLTGLTPDFGFYLSTKTPRVLERLPDEYKEVRQILIRHRDEKLLSTEYSHAGYMYIWSAVPEIQQATHLNYIDLASYMLRLNLLLIYLAPLTYFQEVCYSAANLLLPRTTLLSDFNSRGLQLIWIVLHYLTIAIFFLACALFSSIALWLLAATDKIRKIILERTSKLMQIETIYILLCLMIIFYTIILSAVADMGAARQRAPVDLLIFSLIPLAGKWWQIIRTELRNFSAKIPVGGNHG